MQTQKLRSSAEKQLLRLRCAPLRVTIHFALQYLYERYGRADLMTIGQLSLKSGIPASTLRYWERVKVLPKALRVGGQRRYQPETADLVAVLRLAKACGFSLVEMRRLINGFHPRTSASERWRTAVREHRKVLERQIAELNAMCHLLEHVHGCQCADLVECGRIATKLLGSKRLRS